MVCREIETSAYSTSSKFTHMLWSQIPFSSADTGTVSTGHLDINIHPASLHCQGMNYLNISIYICLYLLCLRQTNCVGYKAGLFMAPEGHSSY